ncbi:recombinase family protein [Hellea sp.]|nr:recombinase family protein [Hellea sp.]MDB4844391.1 recombinase family protein [Hellea sp.]
MTRVAIYARVSTTLDQSCERQIVELKKIAENHGWSVVGVYTDEGVSGAKKSRPALDQMMRDALVKKFDVVATLELSRLGRNVKNMCDIADLLKQKNINLFVKNQNIDTSTIVGELFFNIINSISQYERDLTRERIVSGLENAKRKGVKLGRKSNLNFQTKKMILDMKAKGVGIKKIAASTKVAPATIRKFVASSIPSPVS